MSQGNREPSAVVAIGDEFLDSLTERVAVRVVQTLEPRVALVARRTAEKRLLSLRAGARRLGVSPGRTLQHLIARRKLKTITVAGRVRVPVSEIERIEREGATQVYSSRRRRMSFGSDDAPIGDEEAAK